MSRLIKSSAYISLDEIKKIEAQVRATRQSKTAAAANGQPSAEDDGSLEQEHPSSHAASRLAAELIDQAKAEAEQLLKEARDQAARLIDDAKQQAESWWQEQRQKDEQLQEEARSAGYDAGFAAGRQDAEQQVKEQYEAFIQEGRTVLEQAYEASRQTIAEAEPFLIELSSAIAEKIIGKQLEVSPEWIVDLIQQALKRSIDKSKVTLCVAPQQYSFIQSVRDELANVLDAQAELHILPDASVGDHGCVIKTSFGTIDARIETQLTSIKEALIAVCRQEENTSEE